MSNRKLFSQKWLLTLVAFMSANLVTMAQQPAAGNGAAALSSTATTIRSYGVAANTIVLAIGLIIGLVGAIRVYSKWHNGDPDTMKAVTGWFGAALFLIAVGTVLTAFFGA
jgi:hypothetical protein